VGLVDTGMVEEMAEIRSLLALWPDGGSPERG
jgi:hypothetical protein